MAAPPKKKAAAKKAAPAKAPAKAVKKAASPPVPTKARKLAADEFAPLAPYLRVRGAKKAIDFYKKAFGAQVRMTMEAEDKKRLMHADLIINGGELMLADEFAEFGPPLTRAPDNAKTTTVSIHLQVDDADKWWKRALDAGAQVAMPLADQFWGDRYGQIRDPFGHVWAIASPVKKRR
jgi:PhnB protein